MIGTAAGWWLAAHDRTGLGEAPFGRALEVGWRPEEGLGLQSAAALTVF